MKPFIKPVKVITPIRISRAAPAFPVQRTTCWCRLKKDSTPPVNSPTARKGSTKPRGYTPMSSAAAGAEAEDEAIRSTLPSTGPTQGVQAKLKVKPRTRATSGPMVRPPSRKGSLCSRSSAMECPNTPSWYSPNSTMIMPLIRANHSRLSLKNCPKAVKPKPSRKKVALIPSTKNRVFHITRPLG